MGTQGRLEPHEVAVLRRSLAMGGSIDPGQAARALATLEALHNERAELRALLMRPARCACMRRLVAELRAVLG